LIILHLKFAEFRDFMLWLAVSAQLFPAAKENEECGGFLGIECVANMECVFPQSTVVVSDAAGVCRKVSQTTTATSTPTITKCRPR
jgi:hypothetical protein